ncbi:hypothetical protein ACSYAD_07830 [Acaryochloris marina NIES-2412]|uniref:hypothetical protein n=1 Tax=Acaryochloris marina TaxID=155978 RepID=UPI0040597792
MRTIRLRTCQVIGIGTGIAIAGGCPSSMATFPTTIIQAISNPHRPHLKDAPSAKLHQGEIGKAPQLALSIPPAPFVAGFSTTTSKTDFESQLRSATVLSPTPKRRKSRSPSRHPLAWLPLLFFLGFALGIIRRVKISLISRTNYNYPGSKSYSSSDSNHYSDSGDLSRGDRSEGENN